ncbi:uncharacterized protein [Leuresthes tenuis]|uniref:uncharacterized protein n=1 Tax=Leuresthes tenuis TaxID=355514 RepID=UPI003B5012C7
MFRVESCWVAVGLLSMCFVSEAKDGGKSCSLEPFEGCGGVPKGLYSSPGQRGSEDDVDIYEQLWISNLDIAEKTLNLPFLQHMKLGDLQADAYVSFMIQDINYLLNVTKLLEEMSKKQIPDSDLQRFFQGTFKSYSDFSELMLDQFHLKGVSEIRAIPAMEKYLSDYKSILDQEEPIYAAVSLLPCSRLWLWLANQLPIGYGNAYFAWKRSNMQGDPGRHYRKLLHDHLKTGQQQKKANAIFRQQMQNEHDFFAAAAEH